MTTPKLRAGGTAPAADTSAAVDQFMKRLDHPHKAAIELLRQILCGTDPSIAEGIKWNAPSFRTVDYFATTHLRAADGLGLILHLGAKVRERPAFQIDDPKGLIKWLAKDRAIARFSGFDDLDALRPALENVVRQWIRGV
jgi:hypothetical protein